MGNSRPSLDRVFATALAAVVLGLSAVALSGTSDALGSHFSCDTFGKKGPFRDGTFPYQNGAGFMVDVTFQNSATLVSFANAKPPVAHFLVTTSAGTEDYEYPRRPVTGDSTPHSGPPSRMPLTITSIGFCYIPPPSPTPVPTPTPCLNAAGAPCTPPPPPTPPRLVGPGRLRHARRLRATV